MRQLQNYINGSYVNPAAGKYSQIINPSNGQAYVEAPLSTDADIDAACQAAAAAFGAWRLTTPGERSLLLFRVADALEDHKDLLVEAECENTGKPLHIMRDEEFPGLLDHLRFYAAAARDLRGLAAGTFATGHDSVVRREPVGVCGQVSPWNYPLNMGIWKFGPALAAGNTTVLKPSDTTPVTTAMAAGIIGEILPPGVFNVVIGDRDTGRALVSHPIPRLISVTGSERAGIEVSGAAAPDLKRVHLELGGKAPVLVFDDVDVDAAAEAIAAAGYINAGQDCEAAARVLVHDSIYDQFVECLVKHAKSTIFGPPDTPGAYYGPLNSLMHLEKVSGFIERLPSHAQVVTGGSARRDGGGFFFEPTVVISVRQDDEIVQEEVFGPVITVQSFADEKEALCLANGVRFGLAAGIWTHQHERILRLSAELEFGKVWVNCHLVVAPDMPNNGYKHSGHGNDLSGFAIEDYTRIKHVMSKIDTR